MPINELLSIAAPDYVRLTPAFYEALAAAVLVDEKAELQTVIRAAFQVASLKVTDDRIEWAGARLLREQAEAAEKESEVPKPSPVKAGDGLGTSLVSWLSKLKLKQLCYFLAGFNPTKAEELYYHADAAVVSEAFALRSEYEMELSRSNYEASLYGFGGKYEKDKGQSDANAKMHDLTSGDNRAALNSLHALGF